MEKIISELKKIVSFKDTIDTGDIVLIAAKKPQMLVYALVNGMTRDDAKQDEWYHVSMHILTLPPQKITWTLRPEQMTGQEIFTMDGEERFMKAVVFGSEKTTDKDKHEPGKEGKSSLRRIK
jgi:hypothetical protein